VTPYNFAEGYQRCKVRCCQHLQGRTTWKNKEELHTLEMDRIFSSEMLVFIYETLRRSYCHHSVSVSFFYLSFFISSYYSRFFPSNFSLFDSISFFILLPSLFYILSIFLSFILAVFFFRVNKSMWGRDCHSKFEWDTVCSIH